PALDGTKKVLEALKADGEIIDHCLVGEPTSVDDIGDTVKNGRRGSLNCIITVEGRQGHAAYPEQNNNPVSALLDLLGALRGRVLDDGAPGFGRSNLEVTTLDVGNPAHNVVPARAAAKLNIRFNTAHSGEDLKLWIDSEAAQVAQKRGVVIETRTQITGYPFITPAGDFTALVQNAVREATGAAAELSTSGGTSDARFIKDVCPVIELGLQNATAHMVDEKVRVDDIFKLTDAYEAILKSYFA
ncbi:MAG: succinyl-diaminopimelate desuccinylase, partial [Caulobacterales bacterium]